MIDLLKDYKREKLIQEIYKKIENIHPAIKRRLCEKLIKVFEPILNKNLAKIESKYDANVFRRAEQVISWLIYEYGKLGYIALYYFIRYQEETLEDL